MERTKAFIEDRLRRGELESGREVNRCEVEMVVSLEIERDDDFQRIMLG